MHEESTDLERKKMVKRKIVVDFNTQHNVQRRKTISQLNM